MISLRRNIRVVREHGNPILAQEIQKRAAGNTKRLGSIA